MLSTAVVGFFGLGRSARRAVAIALLEFDRQDGLIFACWPEKLAGAATIDWRYPVAID